MSSNAEQKVFVEKCRSPVRWVVLVLACAMMVGSYYCFDIPAALKTQIDDYMGNPGDYEIKFGLLYTLYAAPNVILPFFGGYLVDSIGVRMTLLLFCSLISVGQLVFTLGLQAKSWPIIFLGRLIFGFGGESFTVANSALLSEWFKGRELAFAFGVNLAISKLGSVFNNLLSPVLAEQVGVVFALWFGCILCGLSLICVVLTIPIDKAMDGGSKGAYTPLLAEDLASPLHSPSHQDANVCLSKSIENSGEGVCLGEGEEREKEASAAPTWQDVLALKHIFWILVVSCVVVYGCILPFNNISSSLLLERDYFREPGSQCQLADIYACQSADNKPQNCPSSSWYQPPLPYNATVDGKTYDPLHADDVDCTQDGWKDDCTKEYCDRQSRAETQVSVIMSIPYIISAVLSPPLGFAIDIYGMRAVIALLAPMLLIVVHALLGYTRMSPVLPLVGQGLAYTGFVSVLWPAVPLVVEDRVVGLAFGIVSSMQNFACAVIPLMVASIYSDSGNSYIPNVELLFVLLAVVGTIVGVYMNYYDYYYGDNVLNSPCMIEISGDDADRPGGEVGDRKLSFGSSVDPRVSQPSQEAAMTTSTEDQCGVEGARARSMDVHQRRQQRSSRTSREHHADGYSHSRRGASFTAYEEVLRGGGYRTAPRIKAKQ